MCVWVRRSAKSPVANPVGGPKGMGAVIFDRGLTQYLDSGPHQFSISTKGGFTAVTVVKLTGEVGAHERIIDFNTQSQNNIILYRNATTSNLNFEIQNGNSSCVVAMPSVIVQNSWLTIVVMYISNTRILQLRVVDNNVATTCAVARTDIMTSNTLVDGNNLSADYSLQGSIAGLHAVDALLSEEEISDIISKMNVREDSLKVCQTCALDRVSLQGSTSILACTLNLYSRQNSSTVDSQNRAIVLVLPRAQVSTLANHNASIYCGV